MTAVTLWFRISGQEAKDGFMIAPQPPYDYTL